jgi:hypothetical protein
MEQEKRGRICIGIPIIGDASPEVLEDYMRFLYYLGRRYQEWDFILGIKSKMDQFRARRDIAQAALQAGCEFIFWLDDDQILDWRGDIGPSSAYEILHKLIQHMDENPKMGICGAVYYQREGACFPVLMHDSREEGGPCTFLMTEELTGGLQQVGVQGGGVMLMRCSALASIPQPWWEPEHQYGTDIQICRRFKQAGWEVWSDTGIEVGHQQKQKAIVTSRNREQFITDFVSKQLEQRPQTLQICVCGWYFEKGWLRKLAQFQPYIMSNRDVVGEWIPDYSLLGIRPNIGLEFGAYSEFLRSEWDEQSDVLFCHDDIEYKGELQTLISAIRTELQTVDQFYVFSDTEDVGLNGARHGRMFACSARLLKWISENGGIWYDVNNRGENKEGPVQLGILNFDYLMAIASTHGFRTRGLLCDPLIRLKRRGE